MYQVIDKNLWLLILLLIMIMMILIILLKLVLCIFKWVFQILLFTVPIY